MDNTINKKDLYNEWIEIADGDYDLAPKVFDSHWPKQHVRICFNCQQAAEKYLKGFLAYNGEEIAKTHILQELLDVCIKYDDEFEALRDKCKYLSPFAVQIRYPNNTFDITEVESKKALEYAKEIIDFVKSKMKDRI